MLAYILTTGACRIEKVDRVTISFTEALASRHPNYDEIIEKYLCSLPKVDSARDVVELQLKALHNRIKDSDYRIFRYEEGSDLFIKYLKRGDEVFKITENDEVITYLILNNKKIVSFSAMNKGKQIIPISVCR